MTDTLRQLEWTEAETDSELSRPNTEDLPEEQAVSESNLALRGIAGATGQAEPARQLANEVLIKPAEIAPKRKRRQPDKNPAESGKGYHGNSHTQDSTGRYLHEIGKHLLLNAAQEQKLAATIETGRAARNILDDREIPLSPRQVINHLSDEQAGIDAKATFIEANLRLVASIARRYPIPSSMELLDLIQEGNLGLEHAVDKFDGSRGFKFSTYATFWIRQSIGRALDKKATLIKFPTDRSVKLRAELRQVEGDGDALSDEVAELHRLATPTSFHRQMSESGDLELGDLLPDTALGPEDTVVNHEYIHQLMDTLEDPRMRRAVILRFGLEDGVGHSYKEVGEAIGVSAEFARRICLRAFGIMREHEGV